MQRLLLAFLISAAMAACGCTHSQLRWNTTHQSKTLTDIYEQQVLDNLAMFVYDPNSLPFFSTPSTGSSQVTDQGSVGSDFGWKAVGFDAAALKLFGQRQMLESWSLSPVSDPRRLELMRCAYQQVVANCSIDSISGCPNCEKLRKRFHLGSANDEKTLAQHTIESGKTTPACLGQACWIGFGCRECVPRCRCEKVGKYCDTYVWLLPDGQDELSKLTLIILDYALNQPAPPPAPKTVDAEIRLKADWTPATKPDETSIILKTTLKVDGDLPVYKPPTAASDEAMNSARDKFLEQLKNQVAPPSSQEQPFQAPHVQPDIYQQQLNLRAVTPPPLRQP
jgi:hypothetical protein